MEISRIARIPRTLRNSGRLIEILRVVVRLGFGDVVTRLGVDAYLASGARLLARWRNTESREGEARRVRHTIEERIRMLFEELGPTFIKLGQILGTRPDIIPMSLVQELRKLQDNVPSFPTPEARSVVESSLGRPLEEVFARFDDVPLAAASIGQVHRGRLHSGEEIVVKVRRPGIERTITTDIDILLFLADLLSSNVPESRPYDPVGIVEEFGRTIRREIDFEREAFNIRRFASNFQEEPDIVVPRLFESYCANRIITMEYIEGAKATETQKLDAMGIDRARVAELGIRSTLRQVFEHGFFHADPHPGNVFILPGNRICLLDFGMMGVLGQDRVDDLLIFLVSLLFHDTRRMVHLLHKMGLVDEFRDTSTFRSELDDVIARYQDRPIAQVDIARLITEVFEIVARNDVQIPSDLYLMGRAIATIEGTVKEVWPEFNPMEAMRPYLLQIYLGRLSNPRFLAKPALEASEDLLRLAQHLPRDLRYLITRLKRGELAIEMRVPTLERGAGMIAHSADRLAFSVIIGAIIVGSSMLMGVPLPGTLLGLPLATALGLAGLILALVMGLGVAWGMLRSGRI